MGFFLFIRFREIEPARPAWPARQVHNQRESATSKRTKPVKTPDFQGYILIIFETSLINTITPMKKIYFFLTAGLVLLLCTACPGPSNKTTTYEVSINQITRANAPALQSFAHATSGNDWLLFAGRTNKDALIGGIHNLNANYADSSFIPKSFNTKIYT